MSESSFDHVVDDSQLRHCLVLSYNAVVWHVVDSISGYLHFLVDNFNNSPFELILEYIRQTVEVFVSTF